MHSSEIGKRRPKNRAHKKPQDNIFVAVNDAAKGQIKDLASRWVSKSRMSGENLMALNPTRADKNIGSFAINVRTGAWADFATDDMGGDIISFYAYIFGMSQIDAARALANELGVEA
ncbi:MAG: hypothetical protein ABJM43_07545 [Paracoccaceae bacterium]|uniref:hypothetical protein n=1 Tax=Paracoccaceae TaxID=31989 RepID=UPI00329A0FFC